MSNIDAKAERVIDAVVYAYIHESVPHLTSKQIAERTGLSASVASKAAWHAFGQPDARIEPTDGYVTVGTAYGTFGPTYERKVQAWTVSKSCLRQMYLRAVGQR